MPLGAEKCSFFTERRRERHFKYCFPILLGEPAGRHGGPAGNGPPCADRVRALEIAGQEILTRNEVAPRINLNAGARFVDVMDNSPVALPSRRTLRSRKK